MDKKIVYWIIGAVVVLLILKQLNLFDFTQLFSAESLPSGNPSTSCTGGGAGGAG
jgi:hypothetical protein